MNELSETKQAMTTNEIWNSILQELPDSLVFAWDPWSSAPMSPCKGNALVNASLIPIQVRCDVIGEDEKCFTGACIDLVCGKSWTKFAYRDTIFQEALVVVGCPPPDQLKSILVQLGRINCTYALLVHAGALASCGDFIDGSGIQVGIPPKKVVMEVNEERQGCVLVCKGLRSRSGLFSLETGLDKIKKEY